MMEATRKAWRSLCASSALMGIALGTATPAHALLSVFGAPSVGVVVTPVVAGTAIGGAAVVSAAGGGKYVAAGAIAAVVLLDPIDATFYNGSFETFFPADLLTPAVSGWLGDWGLDPSKAAPPVGPSILGAFDIQAPNAALSASVTNDLVHGNQIVTFDWGPAGHAESGSGEFNFYAVAFQARQNILITDLGAGAAPLPGANLYGASLGISCSAAGSSVLSSECGSPASSNHSFSVTSVPEPATWLSVLAGLAMLGGVSRRRRAKAR